MRNSGPYAGRRRQIAEDVDLNALKMRGGTCQGWWTRGPKPRASTCAAGTQQTSRHGPFGARVTPDAWRRLATGSQRRRDLRGGSEARQRLLAYGARRFKEGLTRAAHSPGAQSIEAGEVDATRRSLFCFAENKNLSTRGHAGTSEQGRVGCLGGRRAGRACGEASPSALSAIPAPPWTKPPRREAHAASA